MLKLIGRLLCFLTGWKAEGVRPDMPKFVLIAAPHTTNWDFPYTIAFAEIFGLKIRWMGKHTLFKWPFGGFMRALGGIPVHREKRTNMVDAMASDFKNYQELCLTIPAEGTRSRTEYWKSGFYHVALKAGVPIVPGYLDYKRKRGGFGPAIMPTGDIKADMDKIRAFYAGKAGKYPENFGPIRLRDEETGSSDAVSAADALRT